MDKSKTNMEWLKYQKLMKERPNHFTSCNELEIITDERIVSEFEKRTGKIIGVVYESSYRIMIVDLVYDSKSYYAYERILPAVERGAVVIIPIYNGKLVLLNQFRHSIRKYQYAFPRGYAEQGYTAEENCKKELFEELGCEITKMELLGTLISDSGLSGDKVNVYLCEIDSYIEKKGYEGINAVIELSIEEFERSIYGDEINDGYSLAAYSMYKCKKLNSNKNN